MAKWQTLSCRLCERSFKISIGYDRKVCFDCRPKHCSAQQSEKASKANQGRSKRLQNVETNLAALNQMELERRCKSLLQSSPELLVRYKEYLRDHKQIENTYTNKYFKHPKRTGYV